MSKLTKADAANWHMRESTHYNGGDVFFAYLHRCVEQPRLSRFDRYDKKPRSVKSTWRVDGKDQPDFDIAIEALNVEPVFDDAELAFLATVPIEFADIRDGIDWYVNERVKDKGAVEWDHGRARLTEAGREALIDSRQPETKETP